MTTETKHWAAEKAARDRLLAFGTQHGLDSTGVLEVLGIKKLSDYKGTEAEAVGAIAAWAKQQAPPDEPEYQPPAPAYEPVELNQEAVARYDSLCRNLGSVPVWIRMDGRGYYEISVQAWLEPALTRVGLAYARQALEDYQTIFADVMISNGNGAKPTTAPQQAQSNGKGATQTFSPQYLEYGGKSKGDSLYWKAKGHPFNQYGVTVWQETLPAELKDLAMADLTQDLDITGWLATYSLKPSKDDPDQLVPDKVIKLEKA